MARLLWKKNSKRRFSVALAIIMMLTMVPFPVTKASETINPQITYAYTYANAGYAEGTVRLKDVPDGTYYFYWADDTTALEGYHPLKALDVTGGNGVFNISANVAIPVGATKLIAIKGEPLDAPGTSRVVSKEGDASIASVVDVLLHNRYNEPKNKTVVRADAVYTIPQSKRFNATQADRELNFMALSDIHADYRYENTWWINSVNNLKNALQKAADRNVDFIVTAGDNIQGEDNAHAREWQNFLKVIADSEYYGPVYEAIGNHEIYRDVVDYGLELYITNSGLVTETGENAKVPYYTFDAANGDHFIYMGFEKYLNDPEQFSSTQLSWVRGLLEKFEGDGHNTFLIQHALFSKYGPGDDKVNNKYGGALNTAVPSARALIDILEEYKDVIVLSGHSHFAFQYEWNYDNENFTSAQMFHIPSCGNSLVLRSDNGNPEYAIRDNSSEGYFFDVYDDFVIANGTDLSRNKIFPAYSYIVYQTGRELILADNEDLTEAVTVTLDPDGAFADAEAVYCYATNSDGEYNARFPGKIMTQNNDGTYEIQVSSVLPEIQFIGYYEQSGYVKSKVYPAMSNITLDVQTVYFKNTKDWDSVHAYLYNTDQNNNIDTTVTSPGIPMTEMEGTGAEGYYGITIPQFYTYVKFGNDEGDASGVKFVTDVSDLEKLDELMQETMEVLVVPMESTGWVFGQNGALFVYDNETGEKYLVDSATRKAQIPVTATDVTVYRCDGEWDNGGLKDNITEYTKKFGPLIRRMQDDLFVIWSSQVYSWYFEEPGEIELGNSDPNSDSSEKMLIYVDDETSFGVFGSNAATYIYDKDTGKHYEIFTLENRTTGTAEIPKTATNITVYRCNRIWGAGDLSAAADGKMDILNGEDVAYWNKFFLQGEYTEGDNLLTLHNNKVGNDRPCSWSRYNEPDEETILVTIDAAAVSWTFGGDAAVYLYDNDTGKYYLTTQVGTEQRGTVRIPVGMENITVYRCNGVWGKGDAGKDDGVTEYWNAWRLKNTYTPGDNLLKLTNVKLPAHPVSGAEDRECEWTSSIAATTIEAVLPQTIDEPEDSTEIGEEETASLFSVGAFSLDEIYAYENDRYMVGDANGDGKVDDEDLAIIQSYLVNETELSQKDYNAANVEGNGTVSLKDVTRMQMYLENTINWFPAERKDTSTLESLKGVVESVLYLDYRYASYLAYKNLKAAYRNEQVTYNELKSAYDNFMTLKENNNIVTVYFLDIENWGKVSASVIDEEGKSLEWVVSHFDYKLSTGQRCYGFTINQSKYKKVVFSKDNNTKTVTLDIPAVNNKGYFVYDGTTEGGACKVRDFDYTFDRWSAIITS